MCARSWMGQPASVTSVAGSKAMRPMPLLVCMPMKARKMPMPPEVASMTHFGTICVILPRRPLMLITKKIQPWAWVFEV